MNVEKEKAGSPGKVSRPSENFSDDTATVQHPSKKINGVALAPTGYAFADTAEGEPKRLEPVELHPMMLPEPFPLTRERIALRAMMEWVRLCQGHVGKVTAFHYIIGEEKGEPDDIAKALKITERTFRNYRAECRIWLDGFVAGLESEVTHE